MVKILNFGSTISTGHKIQKKNGNFKIFKCRAVEKNQILAQNLNSAKDLTFA